MKAEIILPYQTQHIWKNLLKIIISELQTYRPQKRRSALPKSLARIERLAKTQPQPITLPGSHFYSELSGQASQPREHYLRLANLTTLPTSRASSVPSRTSTSAISAATIAPRRAQITEFTPKIFKKATIFDKTLRSPVRKSGNSLKMARDSQSFQISLDVWGNELNSMFQFDLEYPAVPLSPPQSTRVSDSSEASSSAQFTEESHDDILAFSNALPQQYNSRLTQYDTPLATPDLDGQQSRKTSCQQQFSDGMGFPPTPQFHQPSGTWSQIPVSSESNTYGTPAIHTPETDTPMWWNHAATAPIAQPAPTALYINPQRTTKSLAHQLQDDLSYESSGLSSTAKMPSGLMIQMPDTPLPQSFVVPPPHMQSPYMSQQGNFDHAEPQPPCHQYPPSPRPDVPGDAFHHPQHTTSMSETRSPRGRQSESRCPKTAASKFHVRKRKTKSVKVEAKTPATGTADFVNFTPNDSRKILTGVAPSGSSKTKARREKEARDKRRKLSLAALRAVRAAGGDVESLVQEGLFV
jgi:hypothetical protein